MARFRKRRLASIILLASGLLLGVLWVASAWFVFGCFTPAGLLAIITGHARLHLYPWAPDFWNGSWDPFVHRQGSNFVWFVFYCRYSSGWEIHFPLWLPAAILVLLGIWGIRATRFPAGACASCGYDLRGSESKRCSECGAAIEAA